MEAWGCLLTPAWSHVDETRDASEIVAGAAQVFQTYLQAGLRAVADAAFDEDDGHEEDGKAGAAALDERLALAAQIARAAPDATLPLLRAAVEAKKQTLSTAVSSGSDPTVPLEELWWLARLVPHVLADGSTARFRYHRIRYRSARVAPFARRGVTRRRTLHRVRLAGVFVSG